MKKGIGIILFGIAMLLVSVSWACLDLGWGDYTAFALFNVFSIIGIAFSIVGLVMILRGEKKTDKTEHKSDTEKEDKE